MAVGSRLKKWNRHHRKQHGGTAKAMEAAQIGYYMRRANEREDFLSNCGKPVEHVRDGKPLTEHGARMLGVPWSTE